MVFEIASGDTLVAIEAGSFGKGTVLLLVLGHALAVDLDVAIGALF